MFFSNKNHRLTDRKQRFSIRKYKLGTFSVLVGTLFYMTSISNIQAQEVKDSNISLEIKNKIDKNEEKEYKKENEINKENNLLDNHLKQDDLKNKQDNIQQFQQELEAILQEGRLIALKVQGVEKSELEITLKEIEATIQDPKLLKQGIVASYKDKIHTLKKKSEASNELESKLNKAKELKEEIGSISSSIQYTFEPQEEEMLKEAEAMTASTKTVEEIDSFISKLKQLRNKVANRMTRGHSGKRDSRNGKVIENSGESTFRGIRFTPLENRQNDKVVSNADTNLIYYNSDNFWIRTQVTGDKFRHDTANTYYLVKKVSLSGKPFKDLSIMVSSGRGDLRAPTTIDNINNPNVQAAIIGNLGTNGIIPLGNYQVVLTVNDNVSPANNYSIVYNVTIKSQSERNTVRDLTPTYVDDVRHLTEAERTALIEKFKAEHPDVVNRANHIDFERAEVSADGATMTIYFKDGFSTKTIQTNATNDVEAKHSSLTTLVGDPHEFYKNPRNLVKSKTSHEVPQTARVTWKTPFDFSQPGTKNAVVTVSYDNGVTKDITTPYTVLDFIGKQDKRIYQNQSGELGDARSYITLSNGTAPATDLTIRWKGGSSVDTSAQGTQRKEIEILRGNTVMKTVTIPVAIVDNINPTITAPDSVLLTRAEGLPSNISIDAQDNTRGIGLKDANPIVVENLANPLRYNPSTKRIELSGVIPNNFQRTQATIKAVDKNGNTATKTITFNVQAQTDKYNAVANPQKQTVSYDARPDAGLSINKNGLPAGTTYAWATIPSTTTGPGEKAGVVTVTYPDTSKDTVNVTIAVRKLSDEHDPTGTKIVRNQNAPVTNNDLKAAVNVNNNGNSKVKSVTPVSSISTANAGIQTINATVTYLDGTTDPVTIPLEVKDVTAPTIQTPNDRQNWDLIALDRTLPSIKVAATDNPGGSGIKSTTVTGLPDFLVYDDATKTIKFKNGVQEVTKLPVGQDSKTYNATIQVIDNANNSSQRQVTITVKSMTTKYNATPNTQKQTVSYGDTPDAGTSVNKTGLPARTTYTWATTPATSTTTPGDKQGVVTVTYPDGSKDTVNVTVNVRALNGEYEPTATKITKNQNDSVSNDELKAAVTINNNGNNKVKSVTPVGTISTVNAGTQTINATVTYLDDTTDQVTIQLEVKDVTAPTISAPTNGQNWDLIAVEGQDPNIAVTSEDNTGGSGVKATTVTGLPDFLAYDERTKTIKFKTGVTQVPSLPLGTDVQSHNVTITVVDNAGNETSTPVTITVKSMTTKYDATPNEQKQTVSYGVTPDAGTSVNTSGLPEGTSYAWKTTPVTTTPGEKDGVVEVTYKDGSKDTVNVKVTVKELSSEYEVTGSLIEVNQNTPVTNDDLKAKVTAISKVGNASGIDKISTVVPKAQVSTAAYGETNIEATVTFKDGTTKDVTIPLKVKDVTKPTISAPTNGQNWDLIAVEGQDPNIAVTSEDNTGGSGVKTTTVTGLPNFLAYDEVTKTIKFKTGVTQVPSLPLGTDVQSYNVTITVVDNAGNETSTSVTITVKSMTTKYDATPNEQKQTVSYGVTPDAGTSVNTSGLPEGTSYAWKTTPVTTTPGEKDGVVEVTYKDGSKDTVTVKVIVKELSSEYEVTGSLIEVNQNTPLTNDDLKAKVTATSKVGNASGTDKISTVVPKAQVSTAAYGETNIEATVTFKDGTTKDVTIPLKVKDVTKPTISAPTNGQNWDLIAVEGQDPNIAVTSEDNTGGSGVKTTTVTGLPDFLEYNESTKKIQFKTGVTQVPSLPEGTDVQPHNITITVTDNAGNKTSTPVTITVKSMTTKYDATPNSEKQTVSYGATPDAGTSVNTSGLPEGTSYAWKTTPVTTTPGEKDGVVEVTYKDGSKDTVTVKVIVKELSSEYEVTGSLIEVNQNTPLTNDDLKAKVTATSKVGNASGTDKISTVVPKAQVSTAAYGETNIEATVTFKDGTTKDVTIPLKVKDVTKPTISAPTNGQNWDLIAVEGQDPNIAVTSEDNTGGSGVKATTVTGLPDFLAYDERTKTIKFKTGVTQVPSLPLGTDVQSHNVTITVVDNAGNETSTPVTITVKSMTTKYDATPNEQKQTVSYGVTPDAGTSVNTSGLPEGTSYAWKTTPVTTTPGEKDGVVEVTYKDGSKDTVTVKVIVKELSSEYEVTGSLIEVNQNTPLTNDDLKAKVTATSKVGNASGTDKISTVVPKAQVSTAAYGEINIEAIVTFKDGTTKDVTIPLKVKDVTNPTIQAPAENINWEMTALDKALPNMEVRAEDNANGSGIKNVSVTGLPDYLEYDSTTNTIKFKSGKEAVEKLPENTPSQEFTLNIRAEDNVGNVTEQSAKITVSSMSAKNNPQPKDQTVNYGQEPNPEDSINKKGLPEGTTVTWKIPPVVNTPGEKTGEVEITYPDGSKDVVTVNVTVKKVSEEYTATGSQIEVNQNAEVTSEMLKVAVNATNAQGENGNAKIAKVDSKAAINTEAYGNQTIQAKITYIDGSEQDVTIPLKVKDVTNPTIQTPEENTNWEITALDKVLPNMKVEAVDNVNGSGIETIEVRNIPEYLTFNSATKTIVFKDGIVEVPKFNDDRIMHGVTIVARDKAGNSTSKLVNITVWSMRGKYNPQPIPQTVDNGHVPNAEESINKTGLPEGVTVTWKTTPEVNTPGSHPGVALVHYPDGTEDEVEVPVTVKEQKETFNPTAKEPNQTVRHNEVPDPAKSINTNGLPEGTTYTWSEQPNTSTPGSKPGKVLITYPDHSTEEVPVTVEVTPQKDEYTPTAIPQTVDNGHVPSAEESVNKTGLPEGVTVTWKTTPEVNTPGNHPGVALVHYPDGTEDEVEVPVTVKDSYDKGVPETQPTQPEFTGGVNSPEAPTNEVPAYTDPIGSTGVDENGNLIEPPVVKAPEFSGGVNGEPEKQSEVLEFTGGVNPPEAPTNEIPAYTDPIGSTGVDENGNLIETPVVEAPEFSGGVNGELPDPTQLPKVKLIITKWIDENGNELKPSGAKAPKVLGEANEAFEHGEIDGYEFVRTVVDENGEVVTHIFRKIISTGVGQTNDNVEPEQTPAPTQVSTNESASQPEKVTQKESQTILPNTGTANGLGIFSAAATSILLGLGLVIPIKKEDEEVEE